jgi:hypothetical protein
VDIEAAYDYTDTLHEEVCKLIPSNPCIGAALGISCWPNPLYPICVNKGIMANVIAYILFVHAKIAYQVIDETYDIATLGEYDLALNDILFLCKISGS